MPRIRTIKPEFWTNEQVIELSIPARLLFIGSWNFCDDRGVMPASLKAIKAKVLPADDYSTADIEQLINELLDQGLFSEFQAQDARWWYVTGWKHQKIDRPTASKYPEPPSIRRSADRPLPSEGASDDLVSSESRAHSSADTDAFTEDSTSESRAHSSAADPDTAPVNEDSSSTRRAFDEDSPQGKDRKGKDRSGVEKRESARGARLTLAVLPDDWRAWAASTAPGINIDETWAVFLDYWRAQPGQKGVKTDWLATWRNWVRREAKSNETSRTTRGSGVASRGEQFGAECWDRINSRAVGG